MIFDFNKNIWRSKAHFPKAIILAAFLVCVITVAIAYAFFSYKRSTTPYLVDFSPNKFPEEREMVLDYLEHSLSYPELLQYLREKENIEPKALININKIDINGDGYKDILTLLGYHMFFCGIRNCTFLIFDGKAATLNHKLITLLDVSVLPQGICLLPKKVSGYRDIVFEDISNRAALWHFNGTSYDYVGSVAPACPHKKL